jgi:hypothetical protein
MAPYWIFWFILNSVEITYLVSALASLVDSISWTCHHIIFWWFYDKKIHLYLHITLIRHVKTQVCCELYILVSVKFFQKWVFMLHDRVVWWGLLLFCRLYYFIDPCNKMSHTSDSNQVWVSLMMLSVILTTCILLTQRLVMNNELERMWMETIIF